MHDATRIRALGAALAVVGAFALASTALAGSPPKPADPVIVPGESLGGVSIGQDVAEAEDAWVVAGNCKNQANTRICDYGSRKRGEATIIAKDGAVAIATIMAPYKRGEFVFKGPLMKFGTAKGDLGLGDKLKRIDKRYPGGKEGFRSLVFKDGETRMTFFASDPRADRVTQIILGP